MSRTARARAIESVSYALAVAAGGGFAASAAPEMVDDLLKAVREDLAKRARPKRKGRHAPA